MRLGKMLISRGWVVLGAVGFIGSVMVTASIMFVNARTVALADPRPAAIAPRASGLTLIREIGGPTPTSAPPLPISTAAPADGTLAAAGLSDEASAADVGTSAADATEDTTPARPPARTVSSGSNVGQASVAAPRADPPSAEAISAPVDGSAGSWSPPQPRPTPMPPRRTLGPDAPMQRVATPVRGSGVVPPQPQRVEGRELPATSRVVPVEGGASLGPRPFSWPPDRPEGARGVSPATGAAPTPQSIQVTP